MSVGTSVIEADLVASLVHLSWQFVNHAQFEVNGKKVDIPSYLVKPGDVITVREAKKDNTTIKINIEESAKRPVPAWLERDNEKLSGLNSISTKDFTMTQTVIT